MIATFQKAYYEYYMKVGNQDFLAIAIVNSYAKFQFRLTRFSGPKMQLRIRQGI